jgi:mannosyltransferase
MAPLIVDGIVFSLQSHGGISVYFRQLLFRLARDQIATTLTLYEPMAQSAPIVASGPVIRSRARLLERYRSCELPQGAGLFHSTYYRKPQDSRVPSVVTVHDFTYERCLSGPQRWVHSAQKFSAIRAAQAVICISNTTRDDLLDLVGETPGQTLHVVHNGVDEGFTPLPAAVPKRGFVLFVGQRAGYKNFNLVLRAMVYLPDLELVCVGGGPLRSDELTAVSAQVRHRVRHAGSVADTELNRLYNEAVCLLYPSRYEGFGIPVIEAMRAGCPVLCTECRAVLEVGRNALTVVPENDPIAVAAAVSAIASPERRAHLVLAGLAVAGDYSWERTYQQTCNVYRSLGFFDHMQIRA